MTVTTTTGKKIIIPGVFTPSPNGEVDVFSPNDLTQITSLKQELGTQTDNSVQVSFTTEKSEKESTAVMKGTLHLDQITGGSAPSFPVTVEEKPPAPGLLYKIA